MSRSRPKRARAKTKTPEQEIMSVARSIGLAPEQARRGVVLHQVSNHTAADQRHSVRSGEIKTLRKLTRIEKLKRAGTIEPHEAAACEWYAEMYALGYDTIGCTANYMGAGGGGFGASCLASRYAVQQDARDSYAFARAALEGRALTRIFIPMFEAIVLEGRSLSDAGIGLYEELSRSQRCGKLSAAFRLSANVLHDRIAPWLPRE